MNKNASFSFIRIVAFVGAFAVIVVLLFSSLKQKTVYDNNVLFVVDVSYSMNARDIDGRTQNSGDRIAGKISRLDAAKEIITQMVEAGGVANYGLAIFSQTATQYIPLTADMGTFLDYVKEINTGLLPEGGTSRASLERIFSGNKTEYTKIIFISDAEKSVTRDADRGSWKAGFDKAKKYFIGVGTKEGGNPTLPNGTVMKMKGLPVVSRFDSQTAGVISKALDATFFQIDTVRDLDTMIGQIVTSSPSFSYSQIQILFVVLGMFILLLL